MTTLLALCYVADAVVHFVAYVFIVRRHAIPQSPWAFHVALTPPMVVGVALLFVIAFAVAARVEYVFGVPLPVFRTAYVLTDILWLSILLYYAYWWATHGGAPSGRNEGP